MSEYGRRAVHASGIGMPLLYLLGLASWTQLRYLMIGITVVVFILEFLRLVVGLNHWIYDELTREYEQHSVAGYAYYMLSMTAVALLFGPVVTIPAILMLALGDPFSGMLGENGAHEHKRPAVIGATFGFCFLLAAPFTIPWAGVAAGSAAAAVGALFGAVADGVKPIIRGVAVDDNLTIPPVAAIGIAGTLWLLGVDTGFDPLGL